LKYTAPVFTTFKLRIERILYDYRRRPHSRPAAIVENALWKKRGPSVLEQRLLNQQKLCLAIVAIDLSS